MDRRLALKFIKENKPEQLLDFYNKTYDKLKDINSRIDRITVYIIVVVLLYFVISKSNISSFQVGPISFNDATVIPKLLPLIFSFLVLDLLITTCHRNEVYLMLKYVFVSLYKQDIELKELENNRNNMFTRIVLPFSYTLELSRLSIMKNNILMSIIGFILLLPTPLLYILPFTMEFYLLRDVHSLYYDDILGKLSFWISVWLSALTVFYFALVTLNNFYDLQNEKVNPLNAPED